MTLEEVKVDVTDLQVGMYVCRLDRPWEGTPFLLQGLTVESAEDVALLRSLCLHVYVDIERGLAPAAPSLRLVEPVPRKTAVPARRSYGNDEIAALQGTVAYPERVEFEQELDQARQAHAQAAAFAERALEEVRGGRAIAVEEVRDAVEPMVRSLVRNAHAFLWLDALRARGAYEYRHALSCSALAAAFGRHVGLPEPLLLDMASGGLLLDVGKLRLPPALLASEARYGDAERCQMQTHVESGLAIVDAAGVPEHVREMIRTHHEWIDGSGYPGRMAGDAIPLLGRIAAVIDAYDAMTSDRPHQPAVAPHVALQSLYRGRGSQFAAEIVEQFMQCMSVYPIGALVELSTGEVAIVTAQNAARRLQPRVMVLTDPDKRLLSQFHSIDLLVRAHSDDPVRIASALAPGAYGLDPVDLFL